MKCTLPLFIILSFAFAAKSQENVNPKNVVLSPNEVLKLKAAKSVRYSEFGAKGDGKTDDIEAIAATHEFANLHHLMVKADAGATYYIGGKERTAFIQTDTDFGTAAFIIDDTDVKNRNTPIFTVSSSLKPFKLTKISSLKKNQQKLELDLPSPCLITVTNANVKQYIRFGLNQNNGSFWSTRMVMWIKIHQLFGILIK